MKPSCAQAGVSWPIMSHAARHDSDISSSGMNMNTAPIAPDTSTPSKAMQATVSTTAAPAAPAATARRRA
ncbi:hypothetical protein C7E14_22015, partial [Stenotrophomonas maltophilia]